MDPTTMMWAMLGQFSAQMAKMMQLQQQQHHSGGATPVPQRSSAKMNELKKDLLDEDLLTAVMGFSGTVNPEKLCWCGKSGRNLLSLVQGDSI